MLSCAQCRSSGSWRSHRQPRPAHTSDIVRSSPPAPVHSVVVLPDLLPLPHLLPDGPQTPMQVLALHESQRSKRPKGGFVFGMAQQLMQVCATLLIHVCAGAVPAPKRLPEPVSRAPRPLALLVACHVRDVARLPAFARCLDGIRGQQDGAPTLVLLSWSVSEPSLRDAVIETIRKAAVPRLRAYEQPAPLKQFEHYALLARAASELLGASAWVCFSDDDDVMHPRRCDFERPHPWPALQRDG